MLKILDLHEFISQDMKTFEEQDLSVIKHKKKRIEHEIDEINTKLANFE